MITSTSPAAWFASRMSRRPSWFTSATETSEMPGPTGRVIGCRSLPLPVAHVDRQRAVARIPDDQVVVAVAHQVRRHDLCGLDAGCERPIVEAPIAVREERDGVVGRVDAGEEGALVGDDRGNVARRVAGIHRDRRTEASRLAGPARRKRMSPAPSTMATSGKPSPFRSATRGVLCGSQADGLGLGELTVALVQLDRHGVGGASQWPGRPSRCR